MNEARDWLKLARQTGPPFICQVCNRTYQSQYATFYTHVRVHFALKKQCTLCSVKYLPSREKYHMLKHTKEKLHICPHCNKHYSMANHLNQHLKLRCDAGAQSACKVCLKIFSSYKAMHFHLVNEHGMCQHEEKRSECVICDRISQNKKVCEYCGTKVIRYERHLSTCKAAPITTKFELQNATLCVVCGELCFTRYQLKCHMKKHEDKNSCSCSICGQAFLQKRYLKDHMEIHEPGEYSCEKCSKVFKRRILLKLHKRTHLNIRKFECSSCQKSFKSGGDLKKHLVVHTKVKPFECKMCNKKFGLKSNLNQHSQLHVNDNSLNIKTHLYK